MDNVEKIRSHVSTWVETASMSQLVGLLGFILGTAPARTIGKRSPNSKVFRKMTRYEGATIRARIAGLSTKTAEYDKLRDEIVEETGFTAQQISAAVAGPSAAKNRKRKK